MQGNPVKGPREPDLSGDRGLLRLTPLHMGIFEPGWQADREKAKNIFSDAEKAILDRNCNIFDNER